MKRPRKTAPRRVGKGVSLVIPPNLLNRLNTPLDDPAAAPAKPAHAALAQSANRPPSPRTRARGLRGGGPLFTTHGEFAEVHREWDQKVSCYLHRERRLAWLLDRAARAERAPDRAMFLYCNSVDARCRYARIVDDHLAAHVRQLEAGTPLFWVTLVADRYTVPLAAAAAFSPRSLKAWVRQVLGPCSFVGLIEAALYTNVGLLRSGSQRAVSWHAHLIVWDVSQRELWRRRAGINRRFRTLIPGVKAAHVIAITPTQLTAKIVYASKAPFGDYRVWPRRAQHVDPDTGEVTFPTTGRFRQEKAVLGPGNMVRMCSVMVGRTLDGLTFAAGEGRAVLAGANREALAAFRAWEQRQPWHRRR